MDPECSSLHTIFMQVNDLVECLCAVLYYSNTAACSEQRTISRWQINIISSTPSNRKTERVTKTSPLNTMCWNTRNCKRMVPRDESSCQNWTWFCWLAEEWARDEDFNVGVVTGCPCHSQRIVSFAYMNTHFLNGLATHLFSGPMITTLRHWQLVKYD